MDWAGSVILLILWHLTTINYGGLYIRNRLHDVILGENSVQSIIRKKIAGETKPRCIIIRKKIATEAKPRCLFLFLVMLRTLFSHNKTLCSLFLLAFTLETKNWGTIRGQSATITLLENSFLVINQYKLIEIKSELWVVSTC